MQPFWKRKKLDEMTPQEWESLCDGCGRCCLKKLEDESSGEIFYTNVACRLLDRARCRCTRYATRTADVPDCVELEPTSAEAFRWLPSTCAYRRLADGKPLEWWHPLVSGNPSSVHEAGISVRGRTVAEGRVSPDDLEGHVIRWVKTAARRRA